MTPDVRLEMERLLSALCDEQLSNEEFARLEALLGADAECRQLYLEYVDMHASLLIDPRFCDGLSHTSAPKSLPASGPAPERKANPAAPTKSVPAQERSKAQAGGLHWGRENYRHALLVLGALAASVLVQAFWMPPLFTNQNPEKPGEFSTSPLKKGTYVATLVQSVDCVWDMPRNPGGNGARLTQGKLRLPKGIASIRFDGGPELIVEGPAEINLDSATGVTILSGKVVIRATDSDVPFDLRTPGSTLVDTGAECAVSVSPEAEEVHVFEGELQRVSKKTGSAVEPENLKAGESRRYASQTDLPGKPALDANQFVRHIVDIARPVVDPAAGLLAYEGFDYSSPLALQNGKALGGIGWASPWRASSVRPIAKADRECFSLNVKESLVRSGPALPSIGGSFDYTGFARTYRKLAKPIPLDTDGIYYLSFLFRRQAPADPTSALALLFWTDDDYQQQNFLDYRKRLYIGVKGANQLDTHVERMNANASMPLSDGVTYLLVAKIAASRSKPDQVFLRVYGPQDSVKPEETGRWSVKSPPFRSDLAFEWVELHVNGKSRQTIDEVRIGTTWASVTSPWIGAK
jgi:hypothetical protein